MTNEQREYTIKKIEKNNEVIGRLGATINKAGFWVSASALLAAAFLIGAEIPDRITETVSLVLIGCSIRGSVIIGQTLAEMAGYKASTLNLENNLEMDELEGGKSR